MIAQINWEKVDNLAPAVVQHYLSGEVLMVGYMNAEALQVTLDSGKVTFFSRTKQRLWTKGESSGHFLSLKDISIDCDNDTILVLAQPDGPTCHKGTRTCFNEAKTLPLAFIAQLDDVILSRKGQDPSSSYTASLFAKGIKRISQKVGEEGVETALAATAGDMEELKNESADLLYHLMVLLRACDLSLEEVVQVLQARHSK